jgi:hypothetical protein
MTLWYRWFHREVTERGRGRGTEPAWEIPSVAIAQHWWSKAQGSRPTRCGDSERGGESQEVRR